MSRDQELCSFFCINCTTNERRRHVDVIVKLDTCEADVAAERSESLSCAYNNSLASSCPTVDSDSSPTVHPTVPTVHPTVPDSARQGTSAVPDRQLPDSYPTVRQFRQSDSPTVPDSCPTVPTVSPTVPTVPTARAQRARCLRQPICTRIARASCTTAAFEICCMRCT